MPEGKTIALNPSEYPQLEGLKEGDVIPKITITDSKVISAGEGGELTIEFGQTEITTEGHVDKAYNALRGDQTLGAVGAGESGEEEEEV